jgi:CRP-like cAMP-binding protein
MRWTTRTRGWSNPWEDLEPIDYFAGLPLPSLKAAAAGADWCDLAAGQRLQAEQMHVRWVWVVASGVLEVRRWGRPDGLVLPGAAFGEAEVLLGVPSEVELVAAGPSKVLSLAAPVFHGLLATPEFAGSVARRMARTVLAPAARTEHLVAHA